jgi:hypothetical protein
MGICSSGGVGVRDCCYVFDKVFGAAVSRQRRGIGEFGDVKSSYISQLFIFE